MAPDEHRDAKSVDYQSERVTSKSLTFKTWWLFNESQQEVRLVIGVLLVYLRVSEMLKFLRAKYRIVEVKEKNQTFYEIHVRSVFSLFLWLSVTEPHWDGRETCNRTVDFKTLKEAEDYIYGGCGGVKRKTVKVINT